jgi:hypothetical protein
MPLEIGVDTNSVFLDYPQAGLLEMAASSASCKPNR